MATTAANTPLPQALALADQALRAGDPIAAERVLAPLLPPAGGAPRLLHMLGLVKMHQQDYAQAAGFFARARAADPSAAVLAFSHGTALRWLEQPAAAVEAFRTAIRLNPGYAEAYYEAGATLQQMGALEEAESVLRAWIKTMPGHPRGVLATIAIAIAGTAAMQHLGANVWVPVEVGVLSAVMGAQSIVATRLGVPGISTTFVTGTMVRAVMDFAGTKPESPEILTEGRANAYVWACYLAGAVAGGFALTGLGANALWLPAVVVAVLAGVI